MSDTRYTKDHDYVRTLGDVGVVGITNYAQDQLGDIVFVELPAVGAKIAKGDELAIVESVKAASEIYAPVSGTITEINKALSSEPGRINLDPMGEGWLVKMKFDATDELKDLMDEDAYATHTA